MELPTMRMSLSSMILFVERRLVWFDFSTMNLETIYLSFDHANSSIYALNIYFRPTITFAKMNTLIARISIKMHEFAIALKINAIKKFRSLIQLRLQIQDLAQAQQQLVKPLAQLRAPMDHPHSFLNFWLIVWKNRNRLWLLNICIGNDV